MSDLPERLRSPANVFYEYAADDGKLLQEAADEIDRLRAELAEVERDAARCDHRWKLDHASQRFICRKCGGLP